MDTPVLFISPVFTTLIVYFAIGFQFTLVQVLKFYLSIVMSANSAASLGYCVSVMFEKEESAQIFSNLIIMPFMLFGGFMSNNAVAPVWLSWI